MRRWRWSKKERANELVELFDVMKMKEFSHQYGAVYPMVVGSKRRFATFGEYLWDLEHDGLEGYSV